MCTKTYKATMLGQVYFCPRFPGTLAALGRTGRKLSQAGGSDRNSIRHAGESLLWKQISVKQLSMIRVNKGYINLGE